MPNSLVTTPAASSCKHLVRLLAGAFLCYSSVAFAEESASQWLMRISHASEALNYKGTFVYWHDNQIETMRVIHSVQNGAVRERLFSLNGARREIIRDEEKVWCYIPDRKVGVHQYRQASEKNFPSILPASLDRLTRQYSVKTVKVDRVANRTAQHITIRAKDKLRYSYDLWADQTTGLLLKATLLDTKGMPIETYLFTDLEINATISAKDLEPMTAKSELVWYGSDNKDISVSAQDMPEWEVVNLPKGFTLSRRIKRLSPMRKQVVEHLLYSDGLAMVSVFVEPRKSPMPAKINGLNRMGAVHAFGRVVDQYQITAVGEVPAETVSLIANSVARR